MTAKNFKEVMHNIACSEESEKYYREIRNAKKRRKIVKTGLICSAAIVAVLSAALLTLKLLRPAKELQPTGNNGEALIAVPATESPFYPTDEPPFYPTDEPPGAVETTPSALVDTPNGYRLQLKDSLLNKNEDNVQQLADLEFDSLSDLIETLLKDKFDDWQLEVINTFPSDKDGIKIFDINNAPSIALPDGFEVAAVYWRGEYYSFLVNGKYGEQVYIHWLSEESLSKKKEESINPITFYPGIELLRQNIIDDNTIEYEFTTQTAQLRRIVYQIDPQTCVVETFRVSSIFPDIFTSNEIPNSISVFREENGLCYTVDCFDLITKPDIESLLQFRLQI